jgi:predicted Zn-dependent protease
LHFHHPEVVVQISSIAYIYLLLLCIGSIANAQVNSIYQAAPIQDTIPEFYSTQIKLRLKADLAKADQQESKIAKSVKELLIQRSDYVIENFNNDLFIVDSLYTGFLQNILANIYKANPQLPREATVFAHRSSASNAISFGEGTIAFTLGLLSQLETEAQIAFVLCHELAHHHANHSNDRILSTAKRNNSDEYKREIKAINKSEYGQYTRFVKLVSALEISISKHGREKEFEADSIALIYFANVSDDMRAPIRTLEILDSLDVDDEAEPLDLKQYFDFPDYPFKESWNDYDTQTTWHHSVSDVPDSLRTHPGCKLRIKALQRQMARMSATSVHSRVLNRDNPVFEQSQFEKIESQYHLKDFGGALFDALVLLENYPANGYLHAMVGKCLYQLYSHQKKHELGKVLPLPDSRFGEPYDRLLTFLHTLRLSELSALTYHYMRSKKDSFYTNEDFLFAYWLCGHANPDKIDLTEIKSDYIRKFPNGKYISQFKNQF